MSNDSQTSSDHSHTQQDLRPLMKDRVLPLIDVDDELPPHQPAHLPNPFVSPPVIKFQQYHHKLNPNPSLSRSIPPLGQLEESESLQLRHEDSWNEVLTGIIQGPVSIRSNTKSLYLSLWKYMVHTRITAILHTISSILIICWIKFLFDEYYNYLNLYKKSVDTATSERSIFVHLPLSDWIWVAICVTHAILLLGFMAHIWIFPVQWNFPSIIRTASGSGRQSQQYTAHTRLIIFGQCILLVSLVTVGYLMQASQPIFHQTVSLIALGATILFSMYGLDRHIKLVLRFAMDHGSNRLTHMISDMSLQLFVSYKPLSTPSEDRRFEFPSEEPVTQNPQSVEALGELVCLTSPSDAHEEKKMEHRNQGPMLLSMTDSQSISEDLSSSTSVERVQHGNQRPTDHPATVHSNTVTGDVQLLIRPIWYYRFWICINFFLFILCICLYLVMSVHYIIPYLMNRRDALGFDLITFFMCAVAVVAVDNIILILARTFMRGLVIVLYNFQKENNTETSNVSVTSSAALSTATRHRSFQNYDKIVVFVIPFFLLCKMNAYVAFYTFEPLGFASLSFLVYLILVPLSYQPFQTLDERLLKALVGPHNLSILNTGVHRRHTIQLNAQCLIVNDLTMVIALILAPVIFLLYKVNYHLSSLSDSNLSWNFMHYIQIGFMQLGLQLLTRLVPFAMILLTNDRINAKIRKEDCRIPVASEQSQNSRILLFLVRLKKHYINLMNAWSTTDKRLRYYMWSCAVFVVGLYVFLLFYPQQHMCAVQFQEEGHLHAWLYGTCQ